MLPYLVLLRMGFSVPSNVAADAVSSYLAVSPLPTPSGSSATPCGEASSPLLGFAAASGVKARAGGLLSVPLSVALGLATYSTQPLTGILPCGARTFLPILAYPAIAWPTFREELSHAGSTPAHRRSPSGLPGGAKPRKIRPRVAPDLRNAAVLPRVNALLPLALSPREPPAP